MPDIVELILAEHVRISELIENLDSALADAGPASRGAGPYPAWAALARFLRFHVEAAGEIAYPALASDEHGVALAIKKASEDDTDIREVLEEARLDLATVPSLYRSATFIGLYRNAMVRGGGGPGR